MATRAARADGEPLHDSGWLADYLGVAKKTVYNWHYLGLGPPAYKIGNGIRYRQSEVDQWVRKQAS
jgi:excisionase family DNA binding protein